MAVKWADVITKIMDDAALDGRRSAIINQLAAALDAAVGKDEIATAREARLEFDLSRARKELKETQESRDDARRRCADLSQKVRDVQRELAKEKARQDPPPPEDYARLRERIRDLYQFNEDLMRSEWNLEQKLKGKLSRTRQKLYRRNARIKKLLEELDRARGSKKMTRE